MRVRYAVGGTIREYAEIHPILLRYGGLIELVEDGSVSVCAGILLGRDEVLGGAAWTGEPAEASVDSLVAEQLVDAAADELVERLPEWVRRFAEEIA